MLTISTGRVVGSIATLSIGVQNVGDSKLESVAFQLTIFQRQSNGIYFCYVCIGIGSTAVAQIARIDILIRRQLSASQALVPSKKTY